MTAPADYEGKRLPNRCPHPNKGTPQRHPKYSSACHCKDCAREHDGHSSCVHHLCQSTRYKYNQQKSELLLIAMGLQYSGTKCSHIGNVFGRHGSWLTTNRTPPLTGSRCIHSSIFSSVSPFCTWIRGMCTALNGPIVAHAHEATAIPQKIHMHCASLQEYKSVPI